MEEFLKLPNMHGGHALCEWDVVATNVLSGEVTYHEQGQNLIVDLGRKNVLLQAFGLVGTVTYIALGAGASSTTAAHADAHLVYELTGNANRISLTNTATPGVALSASDVVYDSSGFVDGSGNVYYQHIIVQGIFTLSDGNNGQPFQEYGLFSSATLPGTPTGTSGQMFNRFVAGSPITKDINTQITVNVTIRV